MHFVCICQEEDEARGPFQHNSVMERAEPCCKTVMKVTNIRGKKTQTFLPFKISASFCLQLIGSNQAL